MKNLSKKRLNTEKGTKTNDSFNSFLVETTFNSDIDLNIRKEIDKKFSKSKINSEYKFPRKVIHKKSKSKQLSSKSSFESLSKPNPVHKPSKSSIINLHPDPRPPEKPSSKKVSFDLKPFKLLDYSKEKPRNLSCRQIKTDRNSKSKSPKQSKNPEAKPTVPSTCKKSQAECVNKIFTPYSSKTRLINTAASIRLKKSTTTPNKSTLKTKA